MTDVRTLFQPLLTGCYFGHLFNDECVLRISALTLLRSGFAKLEGEVGTTAGALVPTAINETGVYPPTTNENFWFGQKCW